MVDPLGELLDTLNGFDQVEPAADARVRVDLGREHRKGVPEVILADRKRAEDVLFACKQFLDERGRAIASRVSEDLANQLRQTHADCRAEWYATSGTLVLKRPDFAPPTPGGVVGVLTAGTSDIPVAEQAQVLASEMGCQVVAAYDVGVAGIHRLREPLARMREAAVDVIVVAAGMDGALPSVVAGLVSVPVIGLPTSVGYGMGGRGVAALLSMLQTCAPGLAVVNIDNGVGAGATAGLIARRAAARRVAG